MSDELRIFDHAPILGGAERFALRLAESARELGGPSVTIVCPRESELFERAQAVATLETGHLSIRRLTDRARQLRSALARCEVGRYGRCESCEHSDRSGAPARAPGHRHVRPLLPELLQQLIHLLGFRHEIRLPGQRPQAGSAGVPPAFFP